MKTIADVDKNFSVETTIEKEDIIFHNIKDKPMKIYGVFFENGKFRRIKESVAESLSKGVYWLHSNTAGGRVRFKTNSPYVTINAKMGQLGKMPHFAFTGSIGFDMYVKKDGKERYFKSFVPSVDIVDGYESEITFETVEEREITINFPLYSEVCDLYIGLAEGSSLNACDEYKIAKPFVYYGSSITQGGCASRPGNSYQAMISRRFDADHINIGFSGNARGEVEITDYIKKLDMSLFVYDYDYNAPTAEHLEKTHERMFKGIREENPDLPIIIMSRPKLDFSKEEEDEKRLEIIKRTYNNAVSAGDKNVYFISGQELMKYTDNDGTVDGCHPNDLGFASMAKVLGDKIEEIIGTWK